MYFPKLKGVKIHQKYSEEKKMKMIAIDIIIQELECDLNEFINRKCKKLLTNTENIKEDICIYFNVILAFDFLIKNDLSIEELNFDDIFLM